MINYTELFDNIGIRYSTTGRQWLNTNCPFCGDSKQHLGINLNSGAITCWKCGDHGSSAVMSALNIPYNVYSEFDSIQQRRFQLDTLNSVIKDPITLPSSKLHDLAIKYLQDRNFDPAYLNSKFKLVSTDHNGSYKGVDFKFRILIPYIVDNQIVSFTSRDYTNQSSIRYLTLSKEFEVITHKNILYNIDNVKGESALIVEGCFDAMRIGDNCIATSGIKYTAAQVRFLKDRGIKNAFILFDPETLAQIQAEKLAGDLSAEGIRAEVLTTGIDRDPADFTESEVIYLKRELKI
jgi:DNA primase